MNVIEKPTEKERIEIFEIESKYPQDKIEKLGQANLLGKAMFIQRELDEYRKEVGIFDDEFETFISHCRESEMNGGNAYESLAFELVESYGTKEQVNILETEIEEAHMDYFDMKEAIEQNGGVIVNGTK